MGDFTWYLLCNSDHFFQWSYYSSRFGLWVGIGNLAIWRKVYEGFSKPLNCNTCEGVSVSCSNSCNLLKVKCSTDVPTALSNYMYRSRGKIIGLFREVAAAIPAMVHELSSLDIGMRVVTMCWMYREGRIPLPFFCIPSSRNIPLICSPHV